MGPDESLIGDHVVRAGSGEHGSTGDGAGLGTGGDVGATSGTQAAGQSFPAGIRCDPGGHGVGAVVGDGVACGVGLALGGAVGDGDGAGLGHGMDILIGQPTSNAAHAAIPKTASQRRTSVALAPGRLVLKQRSLRVDVDLTHRRDATGLDLDASTAHAVRPHQEQIRQITAVLLKLARAAIR